jgi:hypothetical protein
MVSIISMSVKYCPFCEMKGEKVEMENMCPKCLAYSVSPETYDKPMHEQPWYGQSEAEQARKLKRAINLTELKKQKGDNIATTKLNQE